MKLNFIIIPLITLIVLLAGSYLSASGMVWYQTLKLPQLAPPGYIIGLVWTLIFILSTISALTIWNLEPKDRRLLFMVVSLFLINALLNVGWSYLFFQLHLIAASIVEMIILNLTVIALIVKLGPISKSAAWLLSPYVIWVTFATYLAYQILLLNR